MTKFWRLQVTEKGEGEPGNGSGREMKRSRIKRSQSNAKKWVRNYSISVGEGKVTKKSRERGIAEGEITTRRG